MLTILENVFTDVNFRGQYIHPKNIIFIMSYKDSCELCGDVILITAALRQYKMSLQASFYSAETVVN